MNATSLTAVSSTPATTSGTYTTQTFLLSITPGSSACTIDGIYTAAQGRFSIQCVQAAVTNNQCPQILNSGAGITLNISSSSFCGQVVSDVAAVLSINSYTDATFATQTSNFLVQPSGVAYFQVAVQSSPEVTVTGLAVSRVQITANHLASGSPTTLTLYQNGITVAGSTFLFSTLPSSGVTTAFSFGMVPAFNIPRDTMDSVVVSGLIQIQYQSVNKKRTVLVRLQSDSGLSTSGHVQSNFQLEGSSSSFAPPSLRSSVLVITAMLVAFGGFLLV